jgi:hypothetical protein
LQAVKSKSSIFTPTTYFNTNTVIVEEKIWMKLTRDGEGKCTIAILFANSSVDEHNEYPKIASPTV